MSAQQQLDMNSILNSIDSYQFEPIKGYPMLNWRGKRPFTSTQYYPAQLKETHGEEVNGWLNKIFWGDNLQVMSHLLKEYRGKVQLVYIDPPFDSKADYKKNIQLRGQSIANDQSSFEDKQYADIWTNDEYLQFMYERLILIRELLANDGSIYIHCDWHKSHHIRCIMDEIFGNGGKDGKCAGFKNEIIWDYSFRMMDLPNFYNRKHDTIFFYTKTENFYFMMPKTAWTKDDLMKSRKQAIHVDEDNIEWIWMPGGKGNSKSKMRRVDEILAEGKAISDVWDIPIISSSSKERVEYPTQKPEALLERIIKASSKKGGLIFDCFMGSGTTQAVAMKLGRRFIGADINLGAVQTTTKRLLNIAKKLEENNQQSDIESDNETSITHYAGFEVYNVNHYDVFRNPVQAKDLLVQALELNPLPRQSSIFDGEKDGWMVKIMPVNRIATRADLNEIISGLDWKAFDQAKAQNPTKPVQKIKLVCMGHEPQLVDALKQEALPYKIDVEVLDILRNKQELQFKRDSEAKVSISNNQLIIEEFYPMNLLEKLSLEKQNVEDWKELVESIMIDFNYDGAVLEPSITDIPNKNEFVKGSYPIPEGAGTIRIKITDLLSESLEMDVANG